MSERRCQCLSGDSYSKVKMASVSSAAPLHSCADESDRIREIVVDIDNLCVVPTTLATLLGAAGETRVLTVEVGGYSLLTVSCNIYNHDATQSCVMLYLFQKKSCMMLHQSLIVNLHRCKGKAQTNLNYIEHSSHLISEFGLLLTRRMCC